MEVIKLKDIAQIQSGIYRKPDFNGDTFYLQVKDFNVNGQLYPMHYLRPEIKFHDKLQNHILKKNDLLFASKGEKNFTYKYNTSIGQALASSTFFVIRINDEKQILPGYLQWFLNHPNSQEYIKAFSRGATVPSIPKKDIAELEIIIPDIERQEWILKVDKLLRLERKLLNQLSEKKEYFYNNVLYNAIRK